MIRPLRIRHRRTIVALSGLVPLLFVAGLLVRGPIPRMEIVPGGTPARPPVGAVVTARSDDSWAELAIRTTWYREEATSRRWVRLEILDELKRPDLLVYWSASRSGATLPDDAVLLGGIADGGTGSWPLPTGKETGGVLLLYSLADAEVVGSADVPEDSPSAPEGLR